MKKITFVASMAAALTAAAILAYSCRHNDRIDSIREKFTEVPTEIRTGVYWYWINDNITREGVEKDLEAMKAVGIDRVQIGNIQSDGTPSGLYPFFSDEWWEITRTAARKAAELDIEFGEFNSPGWSQSGGPWITEEQTMRYVAFMDTVMTGNDSSQSISLPNVKKSQIISIYAYREEPAVERKFRVRADSVISLNTGTPLTVRSISIRTDSEYRTSVTLTADRCDVMSFDFDRSKITKNVGFIPCAPVVENIPEVTASDFTLILGKPSDVMLEVILSENVKVERYAEKTLAKLCPTPAPLWGYYMWEAPLAFRETPGAVNISDIENLNALRDDIAQGDSIVNWKVPQGRWKVSVAYMEPTGQRNAPATPEATGLEVDKMNRKHIRHHFESYLGDMLQRIPEEDRGTFDLAVMDSYEKGGQNWTDDMREQFLKAYGYDPIPYLPAMNGTVVNSPQESERFLWDLRRLVADLVASEYVGGLSEVCRENGLKSWLECYGHWGFPSEFLLYGSYSDEIAGEFWSEGTLGDIENRAASSCGHIYGKNAIWAESCTAGGPQYHRSPRMMKARTDRFFAEGINNTLLHVYISQPDERVPGIDAWFGNEFNRHNTWFSYMDLFTDYLKRCNYLLQQGRYVAQVAYFIGEDAPKMTGECTPALPAGYSFDYINADVLRHHSHIKDGKLCLDSGMEYDVLVLPNQTTMRPEMAECIASFVREGLAVTGPKPVSSPSLQGWPQCDETVKLIADELWGGGKVYPAGTPLETILSEKGINPDFTCANAGDPEYAEDPQILFIHRTLPEAEIYFISNQNDEKSSIFATFDVPEKMNAQLWNPVNGRTSPLPLLKEGGTVGTYMVLDSLESTFIIFSSSFDAPAGAMVPASRVEKEVASPWTVTFLESAGSPSFTVSVDKPSDWTLSDDDRIRFFSGTAEYRSSFILSQEEASAGRVALDIGQVMIMCRVRINGHDAGGLWTPPYTLDITEFVNSGENTIEVDVVNNWRNRLIGDASLLEEERGTWTNINPWRAADELQPSGITGHVKITIEN